MVRTPMIIVSPVTRKFDSPHNMRSWTKWAHSINNQSQLQLHCKVTRCGSVPLDVDHSLVLYHWYSPLCHRTPYKILTLTWGVSKHPGVITDRLKLHSLTDVVKLHLFSGCRLSPCVNELQSLSASKACKGHGEVSNGIKMNIRRDPS
jgi:hypothetical protein